MPPTIRIQAGLKPPVDFAAFDKKAVRKGMRSIGSDVRKIARGLVGHRGVSRPGEFPGKHTGVLQKSIGVRVSRSGFSVAVANYVKGKPASAFAAKGFYPPMVAYGHGPAGSRNRKHKRKAAAAKVVQPRENWIEAAVDKYRGKFRSSVEKILDGAIKISPGGRTK